MSGVNLSLMSLELAVVLIGLGVLLLDLWTPQERKRQLGYAAAGALAIVLAFSFQIQAGQPEFGFNRMFVVDGLALFFKRFFLLAAILVLLMSVEFADRFHAGVSEFYSLVLFALSGMLLAASANDFVIVFVSLELITITFYVLTSFQRSRLASLEAGIKYLILGALSTAFTVYGIALVFGTANTTNFTDLIAAAPALKAQPLFLLGLLLVMAGLGFKLAAFPFQMWAPDVYQGAPPPTAAFLAVGSKAAGIVLLLRVLFTAVPAVTVEWTRLLIIISGVTILYGNLCAIPQRNLKRLLGYSSIAHAGYLLMGVSAMSSTGSSAILYYLTGYLFTVLAAFAVLCVALRNVEGEDITAVAGLYQRSPLLAIVMALAMVSLAGIPPLAGFFGKFLLLKSVVARIGDNPGYICLIGVALAGVVMSFYYYLGIVRAMFWSEPMADRSRIEVSWPTQLALYICAVGMLYLGMFPDSALNLAIAAVSVLRFGS